MTRRFFLSKTMLGKSSKYNIWFVNDRKLLGGPVALFVYRADALDWAKYKNSTSKRGKDY